MVALEAQERESDFALLSKAIEEVCPEAVVTGYSGSISARGKQTHSINFTVMCSGFDVTPEWVESKFGVSFKKGLKSISINGGVQPINMSGNYGPVFMQSSNPIAEIKVELLNVGVALYEMKSKLAWKRWDKEFTGEMDKLLRKK